MNLFCEKNFYVCAACDTRLWIDEQLFANPALIFTYSVCVFIINCLQIKKEVN